MVKHKWLSIRLIKIGEMFKDGFIIRREAVEHGIPLFTSLDTADAIVRVMESRAFSTNPI